MRVGLATSLHLNHGGMPLDAEPGMRLPMQAFVPMGLLALKAMCDRDGVGEVGIVELNTLIEEEAITNDDGFYDHLAHAVLAAGDDMAGLMTDADSLHHTVAIARRIKDLSPGTRICVGGPATSPIGRVFLDRFPEFDFLVRGEGDLTFSDLVGTLEAGRDIAAVRGLTWRQGDSVVENPSRDLVDDLDTLPIPAFDAYSRMADAALYLDVGRGCPFKCRFCATAPFWSRRFRMKSVGRILEEMRLLRDCFGRRHVNFSHDIFTCDQKWTQNFCAEAIRAGLGMTWTCSTRTDVIDEDLLERMAESGCVEIYYGIEAGSQHMQRTIAKNLDLARSREIVAATAQVGIQPVTGFIVGNPLETRDSLNETLSRFFDFLECGSYRAHVFTLCPFHESPMFPEYRNTIGRRAEYHDLPLTPSAAACSMPLLDAHQHIFVSRYRYDTPTVPAALVDASEELSAQLVLLKRIWPRLLRHYDTPLNWYERWVAWIAEENRRIRPGSRLRHQGEALDLLRFIRHEIVRLGVRDHRLDDLVRYEEIKQRASRCLPASAAGAGQPADEVEPGYVVVRNRSQITAAFSSDLAVLVGNRSAADDDGANHPSWVVFAKVAGDTLDTVQIGETAKRLLDRAAEPIRVDELIHDVLFQPVAQGTDAYADCLSLVRRLAQRNLLLEIPQ